MENVVYDAIGGGYNASRRADPYIAGCLYRLLRPEQGTPYLDIGCGTGNYLAALRGKGVQLTGADPSALMLETAAKNNPGADLVCAGADHLPFDDEYFGGAMAVLTFHHWQQRQQSLEELHRVIRPGGRLVFFTFTPQQVHGYWLAHYFPEMIREAARSVPEATEMSRMLATAGFGNLHLEPYFVRDDLEDRFMYAHKSRPEQYLDQDFRNGISSFRLAPNRQEIGDGLARLEADIAGGHIHEVMDRYANDTGDYLFIVAEKPA